MTGAAARVRGAEMSRVGHPTTEAGRLLLGRVAERHPGLGRLLEQSAEFDDLMGREVEPDLQDNLPSSTWLRALLPEDEDGSASQAVVDLLGDASVEDRRSAVAVVVRGLAPHSAMSTVPRASLFTAVEIDTINRHPVPGRVSRSVDMRQAPGRPIDYTGYLCAILKITRACNLRCSYCTDWREGPDSRMPFETLVRSVQQVLGSGAAAVDVVLHGGEPLLVGAHRLLQLLGLLEHFAPPGALVRVQLQTNGTVLDPRVRRILRLFGVRVSVSLDGTRQLHDRSRRDRHGHGSWDRVRRGIAALGADGTLAGLLVVVTPETLAVDPGELWRDVEGTGAPSVCFLAERPAPGEPVRVTRSAYVHFLVQMDRERRRAGARTGIREVDSVGRLLAGEQSGFCELAGSCVGHFVSLDPDGSVSHCDKYLGDPRYVLGNVLRQDLVDVLRGPRTLQIGRREAEASQEHDGCRWSALCQGWCPHERYVDPHWREAGCCGLDVLFEHLERQRSRGDAH